jgi:hypothetical protein
MKQKPKRFQRYRRNGLTAWVVWSNRDVTRMCDERSGTMRDYRTAKILTRWTDTRTHRTDRVAVRYRCPCCRMVVRLMPSAIVRAERKAGR